MRHSRWNESDCCLVFIFFHRASNTVIILFIYFLSQNTGNNKSKTHFLSSSLNWSSIFFFFSQLSLFSFLILIFNDKVYSAMLHSTSPTLVIAYATPYTPCLRAGIRQKGKWPYHDRGFFVIHCLLQPTVALQVMGISNLHHCPFLQSTLCFLLFLKGANSI